MATTFHNDHSPILGSFIQVLANLGRVFHINNVYRFAPGDEPQRSDAELQDEDFERLKDKILARYRSDEERA
jgi:hypothetical protein